MLLKEINIFFKKKEHVHCISISYDLNHNIASSKVRIGNQTVLKTCRAGKRNFSNLHDVNKKLGILGQGLKSPTLVIRSLVVQVVLLQCEDIDKVLDVWDSQELLEPLEVCEVCIDQSASSLAKSNQE